GRHLGSPLLPSFVLRRDLGIVSEVRFSGISEEKYAEKLDLMNGDICGRLRLRLFDGLRILGSLRQLRCLSRCRGDGRVVLARTCEAMEVPISCRCRDGLGQPWCAPRDCIAAAITRKFLLPRLASASLHCGRISRQAVFRRASRASLSSCRNTA